ncbi:hypothetical protein [Bdellovibrio sp. BCCA]|uniref:hypothetical protein n=1 Tax=Bdellovibrio sp. BCCA TaxID=3136281 RepID=UPI0030F0BB79
MKLRYHLLTFGFFLTSLFSQMSVAAETCVTSATDFEAKKSDFPAIVQQLPVMLTADTMFVTAGLKIRTVGSKLKMEGYIWKPGDIYTDDGYLKKVCFDGSNFKVTLENGKTYSAEVKGSRSVSIQGQTFKKSSDAEFAGIVQKIRKAQGGSTKTAGDASGVK